jgi:hypothetical protein
LGVLAGRNGHETVVLVELAEPGVVQVADHVLARTDLRDRTAGGELDRRCGAGADHLGGHPDTTEAAYCGGQRGVLRARRTLSSVPAGTADPDR